MNDLQEKLQCACAVNEFKKGWIGKEVRVHNGCWSLRKFVRTDDTTRDILKRDCNLFYFIPPSIILIQN